MVFQVVYKLCPVRWVLGDLLTQVIQGHVGGKQFGGGQVALAVLDVFLVVFPQTLPGGGVEEESGRLEDNSNTHIQMPVGYVVVQHAGALFATHGAPEQTGGVDAHAEDERGRDEA